MASITITQSEIQDPKTEIRALCWKNPFAVAMLAGKTETRPRATNVRGLVLIVATAKPCTMEELDQYQNGKLYWSMCEAIKNAKVDNLLLNDGYAIGIGRLFRSRPMELTDEDKTFVMFEPWRHCWEFESVSPIKPFKLTGFQGWRIMPPEVKAQIQLYTILDALRDKTDDESKELVKKLENFTHEEPPTGLSENTIKLIAENRKK